MRKQLTHQVSLPPLHFIAVSCCVCGMAFTLPVSAPPPAVKRSRAVSDDDDDNSDDDGGAPGPDRSLAAKLRELGSDSGSEDGEAAAAEEGDAAGKKDERALFGSDSESGDDNQEE